jgi:hypothetical protein
MEATLRMVGVVAGYVGHASSCTGRRSRRYAYQWMAPPGLRQYDLLIDVVIWCEVRHLLFTWCRPRRVPPCLPQRLIAIGITADKTQTIIDWSTRRIVMNKRAAEQSILVVKETLRRYAYKQSCQPNISPSRSPYRDIAPRRN